jgi:hypothetical protein
MALSLWAAPLVIAQSNLVTNGDFEGGFTLVPSLDPLDGSTPDNIPNGWTRYETFSADTLEMSILNRGAAGDNGPGLPGASSLISTRGDPGTLSGDWTAVYQDLNIDASECSALTLNVDVKVISHDLPAGGFLCNVGLTAFEWPVIVQIDYVTTTGDTQIWRHGWYLGNDSTPEPAGQPGDLGCPASFPSCPGSSADDCGVGLIGVFNDEQVTQGAWDANSFNLVAELPQLDTIKRIYVGGSGWNFQGQVDNVEILCTPHVPPGVPTLSQWGIIAMMIALGATVLLILRRKAGSPRA